MTLPPSTGHSTISRVIFGCHNWRTRMLLTSHGWKLGILLNILQCTGQPHYKGFPRPKCQQCCCWETLIQTNKGDAYKKSEPLPEERAPRWSWNRQIPLQVQCLAQTRFSIVFIFFLLVLSLTYFPSLLPTPTLSQTSSQKLTLLPPGPWSLFTTISSTT